MSKRRKRKPSRRERRAGVDRPAKRQPEAAGTQAPAAEAAPRGPQSEEPSQPEPQAQEPAVRFTPGAAEQSPVQPSVSATFQPSTKSETTVALEQRFIGRDLRRLVVQLAAFAAVVAALAVLDAQTDAIGKLGSSLFGLWE